MLQLQHSYCLQIPLGICLGQDNTEVGEEPKIKVESVQQVRVQI